MGCGGSGEVPNNSVGNADDKQLAPHKGACQGRLRLCLCDGSLHFTCSEDASASNVVLVIGGPILTEAVPLEKRGARVQKVTSCLLSKEMVSEV